MEDKFPKIKENVLTIRNNLIEPFKKTLELIPKKKIWLEYYEEYMLLRYNCSDFCVDVFIVFNKIVVFFSSWFKEVHKGIVEIKLATDVISAEESIELINEVKTQIDSKNEEIEKFYAKGIIL